MAIHGNSASCVVPYVLKMATYCFCITTPLAAASLRPVEAQTRSAPVLPLT